MSEQMNQPPITRATDYVDTYANVVRMATNPAGFTIILGSMDDRGPGDLRQMDRVSVNMSPQFLKVLSLQIGANVRAYEEVFGSINIGTVITNSVEGLYQNVVDQFRSWNAPQAVNPSATVSQPPS